MSTTPVPDLAGYVDAQRRLRKSVGRDIRFFGPAAKTWDVSVTAGQFDPETNLPYDPVLRPVAEASANVGIPDLTVVGSARASVVFQPLTAMRRDEVAEDQMSERSRLNKDLILDINDLPQASGASHFQVGQASGAVFIPDDPEVWEIVNLKVDGIGGAQRVVVFGQGTR